MASAEPSAEEAAEAEEDMDEEIPCARTELSQRLAVEELISTEASYVHNLQLCVSDIRAHLQSKQVRRALTCPGAADGWRVNLSRAMRCPNHGRELTGCSPFTFLCSP